MNHVPDDVATGRSPRRTTTGILAMVITGLTAAAAAVAFSAHDAEPGAIRRATPDEAAVLVLVRGVGLCSGAPISGTNLVATAAHCLLDPNTGKVSDRVDLRVERGDVRYDIESVIVDTSVSLRDGDGGVRPDRDGALLVMREPVPGPGVDLVDTWDRIEDVVIVGYQPVGANGTFSRPATYQGRRAADDASILLARTAAACRARWKDAIRSDRALVLPCGMIPGASGGPVIEHGKDGNRLVGILSSVNYDLTRNGITPVNVLLGLLADTDRYTNTIEKPVYNPDARLR